MNWTTTRSRESSHARRAVCFLALFNSLALLVGATSRAATVIQVRVGNHSAFTRVVFETDRSVGYQIARSGADGGVPLITVTLEATSRMRNIPSKSAGVVLVSVEEGVGRTVAKIQLRHPNLQVREMILSNPPRLVLDIDHGTVPVAIAPLPDSLAVSRSASKPSTPPVVATRSEPETVQLEAAQSDAAQPEAAYSELAVVEPESEWVTSESEAVDRAAVIAEIAESTTTPQLDGSETPVVRAHDDVREEVESAALREMTAADLATRTENRDLVADRTAGVAKHRDSDLSDSPIARTEPSKPDNRPRRIAVTEAASTQSSMNYQVIAAAVGFVVSVALAAVVLRRRRSLPDDPDLATLSEEPVAGEPSDATDSQSTNKIPHEGFSMTEESATEAVRQVAEDTTATYSMHEVSAGEVDRETAFFDENSEGEKAMEQNAVDLPAERGEFSAPQPAATESGDSSVAAMVQELAGRIATLEDRLSESDGARERLERQVAAQTEELRVQRAAIARTQRALRSMSRSEEDQATEPALRKPAADAGSAA